MIIWLASYPRSGNTFLRVVLKSVFGLETYSIYDDKSDIAKDAATQEIVGHKMLPADFDLESARNSEQLYIIKTHEHSQNPDDKVIYLIRDGRESAVSYLNYIRSFHNQDCKVEDVLYGNVPFGTWAEHIRSWKPGNTENSLLLKFEEFTSSPQSFLEQLSNFLNAAEQGQEIPAFEDLHRVNPEFFRQGRYDSWKEDLGPDELLAFWLINYSQMLEFYPGGAPPELLAEMPHAAEFSELFRKQCNYFNEVVSNLETAKKTLVKERAELSAQRNNLSREKDQLLKHTDQLVKHRDQLAQRRDELLNQLSLLENRVQILEGNFNVTTERLNRVRAATDELTDIKAWKGPFRKYKAYKKLLQSVLQRET